jgi:hypothetical protein
MTALEIYFGEESPDTSLVFMTKKTVAGNTRLE